LNPSAPSNYTGSAQLLTAALGGMDYWFANDFTSEDCIGQGGLSCVYTSMCERRR
jgi:hypothetical protein